MLSVVISLSKASFNSLFANDFGKSAKDGGLKIDTNVVLHEEMVGRPSVAGSPIISRACVADHD